MSAKYRILLKGKDGAPDTIEDVEGTRFTVYIQNIAFRFFVHKQLGRIFGLQVSHLDSGNKVCDVEHLQRQAALGDDIEAAKLAVAALIKRAGEARVRSVLSAAESLPKR